MEEVDSLTLSLQQSRLKAVRRMETLADREVRHYREELKTAKQRCAYLEAQLERTRTGKASLPCIVGDLERVATTQAMILFPSIGYTQVYKLSPDDIRLLSLSNRDPCLSCEPL